MANNYRRRIETEGKAKVVASVWGTKFAQFLAAVNLKERVELNHFIQIRVGHAFFSKERNVLAFFSVLYKRTQRSLRSFALFIKERGVLCVLLLSLQKNIAFFVFFYVLRVEFIQTVENSMIQIRVLSERYKLINLPCKKKIAQERMRNPPKNSPGEIRRNTVLTSL